MLFDNRLLGYVYITFGLLCILFFLGPVFFKIVAVLMGLSLIKQGLQLLSFDRTLYYSSMKFFNDQFRR